jgi:hypothetical protein
LSNARNAGVAIADGQIVAFIDDDAWPQRDWLTYLVATLMSGTDAGVGGPNIPPPTDSLLETAVAQAPGGPIHVLLSDTQAEHIPGCNMAFRREALIALGGFDSQFTIAGDDVDICWRVLEQGWTLGYSPGAMVWHRRRSSIWRYFKQQLEYGKAEALLERKWPEKYNRGGHVDWSGRVYGGVKGMAARRWRVYYGTWASGLFQSLYERSPTTSGSLPLMPEWYLLLGILALTSIVDAARGTLLLPVLHVPFQLPLFLAAAGVVVVNALRSARAATRQRSRPGQRRRLVATTTLLCLLQPLARLSGRMSRGLTPWRRRGRIGFTLPLPQTRTVWSERWISQQDWLAAIEKRLRPRPMTVLRGSDFDRWDLQVRVGPLGAVRLRSAVEEHGDGKQLVRFRIWPVWTRWLALLLAPLLLWWGLAITRDPLEAVLVSAVGLFLLARSIRDAGAAFALLREAIDCAESQPDEPAAVAADPPEEAMLFREASAAAWAGLARAENGGASPDSRLVDPEGRGFIGALDRADDA